MSVEARSDICYFAGEFGQSVLSKLLLMYFPGENSIQQNIELIIKFFGMYILLCFIETAKPVNPKNYTSMKTKDDLVSSCLKNVIRVEDIYDYFLSILDYILSEDIVKKEKHILDKINAMQP